MSILFKWPYTLKSNTGMTMWSITQDFECDVAQLPQAIIRSLSSVNRYKVKKKKKRSNWNMCHAQKLDAFTKYKAAFNIQAAACSIIIAMMHISSIDWILCLCFLLVVADDRIDFTLCGDHRDQLKMWFFLTLYFQQMLRDRDLYPLCFSWLCKSREIPIFWLIERCKPIDRIYSRYTRASACSTR